MITSEQDAFFDAVRRPVQQTVKAFRARGAKAPHSIEQAALALGMPPGRVRSLFYGDRRAAIHWLEYEAIMRARIAHLHREVADLERLTGELRNIARQAELKLEAEQSARGSGWGVFGVGWRRSAPGVGAVR